MHAQVQSPGSFLLRWLCCLTLFCAQSLFAAEPRTTFRTIPSGNVNVGETTTFVLSVTNTGPAAIPVHVRATFPEPNRFRFISLAAGCVITSSGAPDQFQVATCELGVLAVGSGVVLNFQGAFFDQGSAGASAIVWDDTGDVWNMVGVRVTANADNGAVQLEPFLFPGSGDTPEGGVAVFRVRRMYGTSGTITVDYFTSGASAVENVDYLGKRGTLTFSNGEWLKVVEVPTLPDREPECNKSFSMQLTNATGGAVLRPGYEVASVSIIDDDLRPLGTVEGVTTYPSLPGMTFQQGGSFQSMTDDGRDILFSSSSPELVGGDNNGQPDLFLRRQDLGVITLVTANRFGTGTGNGPAGLGRLSGDGRWVTFTSQATDLVTNQVSGSWDVYARELISGKTQLVSVSTNGGGGNGDSGFNWPWGGALLKISSNGTWVVFESTATDLVPGSQNRLLNIYARHLPSGVTRRVTSAFAMGTPNADCYLRDISRDGRHVLFDTQASNLLPANPSGGVFVYDTTTSATVFVGAGQGVQLSADGRLALCSLGPSLYLRDLVLQTNHPVASDAEPASASMSPDGRYVVFTGTATNGMGDLAASGWGGFRHDRVTGTTLLATERCLGGFLPGPFRLVSGQLRVSDDGRYVAFSGSDRELGYAQVNSGLNVFRRDMVESSTEIVSLNYALTGTAYGNSGLEAFSGDGRNVVFWSDTIALLPQDQNVTNDVFVWREHPPGANAEIRSTTTLVSYGTNLVFLAVTVKNFGPDEATGVVLTTTLPPGLEPLSATTTGGVCTVQAGAVVCQVGDLAAATGASVQISVMSTITNSVQVTTSAMSAQHDPASWNNVSSVPVFPGAIGPPGGDVLVSFRSVLDTVMAGQTTTFILTVTNTGTEPQLVYARVTLDPSTKVLSMPEGCQVSGGQATCEFGAVPGHSRASLSWLIQVFEPGVAFMRADVWGPTRVWQLSAVASVVVTGGSGQFQWENNLVWLRENGQETLLKVVRTAGAVGTVSVDYTVSGETALANSDFIAASGTLTFAEGETVKTLAVRALPDEESECDETFTVRLSNPTGGAVLKSSADPVVTVHIADDEPPRRGVVEGVTTYPDYPWATVSFGGEWYRHTSLSQDGAKIAFSSLSGDFTSLDQNAEVDVFLRDLTERRTLLVSLNRFGTGSGNSTSWGGIVSADGRWVAFNSYATDLVTNHTTHVGDVFVRDLVSGTTRLVSVTANGDGGNAWSQLDLESLGPTRRVLSRDGSWLVFKSDATDLGPGSGELFARHIPSGTTRRVAPRRDGSQAGSGSFQMRELTPDGRYVLFDSTADNLVPEDVDTVSDVFVSDLVLSNITLVTVDERGTGRQISSDGRYVLFEGIGVVFLRDLWQRSTEVISVDPTSAEAGDWSSQSMMSPDARYIVFLSAQTNLVAGDYTTGKKVFLRDRGAGTTEIASLRCDGIPTVGSSPRINDDGRYVSFESTEVVPGTSPGLFRRDRVARVTEQLNMNYAGTGGASSSNPVETGSILDGMSGDGTTVAFWNGQSDLVLEDGNGVLDLFAWRQYPPGPVSDLRISMRTGSSATNLVVLTVGLTNFGPDKATSIVVTQSFPPGLVPLAGANSAGVLTIVGTNVLWELNELETRRGAAIQLSVFSTIVAPSFVVAQALATEYDPLPWNGRSVLVIQPGPAVPAPPLNGLSIAHYENITLVRWHSAPAGAVLEQTTSFAAPVRWEPVVGAFDDGVFRTWSTTNVLSQQFFRLRTP